VGWVVTSPRASPTHSSYPLATRPSSGLAGSGSAAMLAQAHQGLLLPALSLVRLFEELGLQEHAPRFEEEAIRLDMLLTMDAEQMSKLGRA